jgi:uncharacterized protein HemX
MSQHSSDSTDATNTNRSSSDQLNKQSTPHSTSDNAGAKNKANTDANSQKSQKNTTQSNSSSKGTQNQTAAKKSSANNRQSTADKKSANRSGSDTKSGRCRFWVMGGWLIALAALLIACFNFYRFQMEPDDQPASQKVSMQSKGKGFNPNKLKQQKARMDNLAQKVASVQKQHKQLDTKFSGIKSTTEQNNNRIKQINQQLQKTRSAINQHEGTSKQRYNTIENTLGKHQSDIKNLKQKVAAIPKTPSKTKIEKQIKILKLSSALTDLKTAGQLYQLRGPHQAVNNLVQQAYALLAAFKGVSQSTLYKLDQLQSTLKKQNADKRAGEIARLDTLEKQATRLTFKTPGENTLQKADNQTDKKEGSSWKQAFDASWRRIQNLVSVQKLSPQDQKLLSKQNRAYILRNLQFHLKQAKFAALEHDAKLFKQTKQKAIQIVKRYFKQTKEQKNWLKQAISLQLADHSGTLAQLNAIQNAVKKLLNQTDSSALPSLDSQKSSLSDHHGVKTNQSQSQTDKGQKKGDNK